MANDAFTTKWNEKRMEENDGLRTVECLRGRLQAERASSKAANDESEQIGKKVIELEKQLKIEIKSRNKAEKRLNFLLKKLDSLNISYDVSTDDQSSSFSEKSKGSSVASSCKSQHQMELQKAQFNNTGERHNCPSNEENFGCLDEAISENSVQSSQKDGDDDELKKDESNGSKSFATTNNTSNEEHNQDTDHNVDNSMALIIVEEDTITKPTNNEDSFDNSMALVVVNSRVAEEKQDVPICDANVKDVLDALRYARESLQTSIEMRRHIIQTLLNLDSIGSHVNIFLNNSISTPFF